MKFLICALALLAAWPAQAKHRHHAYYLAQGKLSQSQITRPHKKLVLSLPPEHHPASGLVTVPTAAGISITVASSMASKMQGFIADLVASGYKPHSIACYSPTGHMPNSLHHVGEACDIDQSARNVTAGAMYHVGAFAAAHGLRDGCSFHDCGHIDSGRNR